MLCSCQTQRSHFRESPTCSACGQFWRKVLLLRCSLSRLRNHIVSLQALSAAVKADKEEWVGVIGRAVGSFDGQLDLAAVMKGSSAVSLLPLHCFK